MQMQQLIRPPLGFIQVSLGQLSAGTEPAQVPFEISYQCHWHLTVEWNEALGNQSIPFSPEVTPWICHPRKRCARVAAEKHPRHSRRWYWCFSCYMGMVLNSDLMSGQILMPLSSLFGSFAFQSAIGMGWECWWRSCKPHKPQYFSGFHPGGLLYMGAHTESEHSLPGSLFSCIYPSARRALCAPPPRAHFGGMPGWPRSCPSPFCQSHLHTLPICSYSASFSGRMHQHKIAISQLQDRKMFA